MSRKKFKILTRKERRKNKTMGKFYTGDTVRVKQYQRTAPFIINVHGTESTVEAIFGGRYNYRLKGSAILFEEGELELVKRAHAGNPPVPEVRSAIINEPYKYPSKSSVDYLKMISEV